MKMIISLLLIGLFYSSGVFAEEVTVGKVSKTGKKAVIYIPEGMTVEKGQTLVIGGGDSKEQVMLPSGVSARSKAIGGDFVFFSNTTEVTAKGQQPVSEDDTEMFLRASFIKNNVNFEFGGGLTYSSSSTTTLKSSSYGLTGLFEYNFMPNKPGTTVVAHAGGQIGYESGSSETNAGANPDTSGLTYGLYGGVKYFMVPSSGFAILADAIYLVDNSNSSDDLDVSISRIGLRAGVRYYF